uniref:Uncharacterized protein n=1 Tax=Taeniopygia guttata TaxID=59729 RepID=A0A674GL72_TAEGU
VGKAQVQNLVIMLLQGLHLHARDGVVEPLELIRTWVPRHVPGHAVVAVEKLLPQEFVAGHGAPLLADKPHREHVGVVQVQEDLEQDAVREPGAARVHRVILPRGAARPRSPPGPAPRPAPLPALRPAPLPARPRSLRSARPRSPPGLAPCAPPGPAPRPASLPALRPAPLPARPRSLRSARPRSLRSARPRSPPGPAPCAPPGPRWPRR